MYTLTPQTFYGKMFFLTFFTLILILFTFLLPALPQNLDYHNFADCRKLFCIPNFANVVSNIFFLIVGIYGLIYLKQNKQNKFIVSSEKYPFYAIFIGLILTAFGSAFYHWNPNNFTLFWDRASMTIVAMGFLSMLLSDRISPKFGLISIIPLLIVGLVSVIGWEYSEFIGKGDLRFYFFITYYPIVMLPILLFFFPSRYTGSYYITEAVIWYALAKTTELFDKPIYNITHSIISGHTIKHILAATAIYSLIRYLKFRKIKPKFASK